MSLLGKLVLVTGGGSGIGAAVCQLFAEEGARIICVDIDGKATEKVIQSIPGTNHLSWPTDVSQSSQVDALAEAILQHYSNEPPSIVVHCAGIVRNFGGIADCTEAVWDQVINVNLKGTYLINRKFILLMRDRKISGSIVNICSVSRYGLSACPEYSASKAGQVGLTLALSKEFAPLGVRVNAVDPGSIDTPFVVNAGVDPAEVKERANRVDLPMGRMGTPREVAQVCLFLASDKSSYVTGSAYEVHGGMYSIK